MARRPAARVPRHLCASQRREVSRRNTLVRGGGPCRGPQKHTRGGGPFRGPQKPTRGGGPFRGPQSTEILLLLYLKNGNAVVAAIHCAFAGTPQNALINLCINVFNNKNSQLVETSTATHDAILLLLCMTNY